MPANPLTAEQLELLRSLPANADEVTTEMLDPILRVGGFLRFGTGMKWHRTSAADTLLATIDALTPPPSQWQEISSAPKDGTWILGWDPEWPDDIQQILWSETEYVRSELVKRGNFAWRDCCGSEYSPSHWMPAPTPPGAPLQEDAATDQAVPDHKKGESVVMEDVNARLDDGTVHLGRPINTELAQSMERLGIDEEWRTGFQVTIQHLPEGAE